MKQRPDHLETQELQVYGFANQILPFAIGSFATFRNMWSGVPTCRIRQNKTNCSRDFTAFDIDKGHDKTDQGGIG